MSLAQMSQAGSLLILFIIVLRALAIHRLPKITFGVLWEVVALRLLLPFSIPSPLNIPMVLDQLIDPVQQKATNLTISQQGQPSFSVLSDASGASGADQLSVLTLVWLAGVIFMAAYFLVTYFKSISKFSLSIPSEMESVERWLEQHRTIRPLQVRVSDRILSPITYGFIHPVILLPKKMNYKNSALLIYTLTHEYVHVRRFDVAIKLIFAAALCVHWFNPCVWIMFALANRDMELSCDERVIQILGEQKKAAYALALIDMEEAKHSNLSLCSHFSKYAIEERTLSILRYKKQSVFAVVLAVLLVVGATLLVAVSPVVSDKSDSRSDFSHASALTPLWPSDAGTADLCSMNELEDWLTALSAEVDGLVAQGQLTQQQASEVMTFYQSQVANLQSAAQEGHELLVDRAGGSSQPIPYGIDQLRYLPPTVYQITEHYLAGETFPEIAAVLPESDGLSLFAADF